MVIEKDGIAFELMINGEFVLSGLIVKQAMLK